MTCGFRLCLLILAGRRSAPALARARRREPGRAQGHRVAGGRGGASCRRLAHSFVVEGRTYVADLYLPRQPAKAALVLVPGAAPRGKDDSRLVAFAEAIARARFLVLVPEIESLRDMRVSPTDMQAIGDAVVYLAGQTEDSGVGLVAISYSAGPAVIVALQERTRSLVAFVLSVGGYYDIEALVTFFTTGYFRLTPEADWAIPGPIPMAAGCSCGAMSRASTMPPTARSSARWRSASCAIQTQRSAS